MLFLTTITLSKYSWPLRKSEFIWYIFNSHAWSFTNKLDFAFFLKPFSFTSCFSKEVILLRKAFLSAEKN